MEIETADGGLMEGTFEFLLRIMNLNLKFKI